MSPISGGIKPFNHLIIQPSNHLTIQPSNHQTIKLFFSSLATFQREIQSIDIETKKQVIHSETKQFQTVKIQSHENK